MIDLSQNTPRGRILGVDLARSAAILGMIVFHLVRDLEIFGLVPPGTTLTGGWALFARLIAGSFLFLAGVSLVLAHADGIHWRAFWRRLAIVSGAALLITIATGIALPERFIYFGILHAIALSSLIAVVFARLPAALALGAALAVWGADLWLGRSLDLPLWLGWTGLGVSVRPSLDFLPLVPWLAPCLLGVAAAKALRRYLIPSQTGPMIRRLAWPGRHSLAIYLLHQPVLLGGLGAARWMEWI